MGDEREQVGNEAPVRPDAWRALWAKSNPYHPLWKHLLDTAAVSLALPNPLKNWGWSPEVVALVVGLHDVGKSDGRFQHQDPPGFSERISSAGFGKTEDGPCRHERLSARFLREILKVEGLSDRDADTVGRAVIAHHGYWDEGDRGVGQSYCRAQQALLQVLRDVLGLENLCFPALSDHSALGMRLSGHIVLCDWIASNEEFFQDVHLQGIDHPAEYFAQSRVVAEDWVKRLGLRRACDDDKASEVVPTPRPLQQAILDSDIPPGLVIIEAPMGEGKTEAAWILAEKWRKHGYQGMYMALPTMATSDSLHSRYRDDYLRKLGRNEAAHLVHGMAWLRDEKEPEKAPETGEPGDDRSTVAAWFRPTRRAMLAAHGVGTVDQAMLAGMHVKFGFLRLYGLADRVLVIDEVHAYDAYMSAIICRLLQWCACLKIPVILLSATLSARQRAAMIEAYGATVGDPGPQVPYPLITVAEPNREAEAIPTNASSTRCLRFEAHWGTLGDAEATAALAMKLVEPGGCCCVILNTVKQAQAVYKALGNGVPMLLFHARFTAADRERITKNVLELFGKNTTNRPEKFILVATQVVEQSLDVDFDHMITEIAPMDLLLQRSGRLHRHLARAGHPTLHVLAPPRGSDDFGSIQYVYSRKPLYRTSAQLEFCHMAHVPDDFRQLVEGTYGEGRLAASSWEWDRLAKADAEWTKEVSDFEQQGNQFCLCEPSPRAFRPVNNAPSGDDSDDGNGWRAKTRLGANDRTTILVQQEELGRLMEGKIKLSEVKDVYRRALKTARYLPLHSPLDGYGPAVEGSERMRGVLLLPMDEEGAWRGADDRGNTYRVSYDLELGLLAGRES